MSNNYIDALVYSGIKNNLSLTDLNTTGLSTRIVAPDPSQTTQYLDRMLDKTTIKRACCVNMGRPGITTSNFDVTVRLPIPTNYDFTGNPLSDTWKKFGYIDKTVSVPSSMCSGLDGTYNYNSDKCQDFMALYCNNVKAFYKNELSSTGGSYNDDEFSKYKPECSCYGDQPPYLTGALAPVCFAPGCDPNNSKVFQDTNSRQGCAVTICQSNFNAAGLTAGGAVSVNTKVQQTCGNQINQPTATTNPASITPVTSIQTQPVGTNTGMTSTGTIIPTSSIGIQAPTITQSPTDTQIPTISPTITPTPTISPTITPTISPTITPTISPTIAPTITQTPTIASTITPTPTIASTITQTPTVIQPSRPPATSTTTTTTSGTPSTSKTSSLLSGTPSTLTSPSPSGTSNTTINTTTFSTTVIAGIISILIIIIMVVLYFIFRK
mgnify:CR=1 FL=1